MAAEQAILLEGVCKRFGAFTALHPLDLRVPRGAFLLLAGANGAGKSTLLRLLAGLSRPTAGTLRVEGASPLGSSPARRSIGLLSHQTLLYEDLTARENLLFFARLYGLDRAQDRAEEALDRAGLLARQHDRVRTFSRGMKQRLALARATLHRPSVLLFDEPFTGLDARASEALARRLAAFRQEGSTCVLVTHHLEEALELMDCLAVLHRGRLCYEGAWGGGPLAQLQALCARPLEEGP